MCPVASIVIRAKNEEALLARTLSGVFSQTLDDIEVILVDSGSTDHTLEIAQKFPVKIIEIRPQDFTYGRALNAGCAKAKGEFLVALSAHAIPLTRDWLKLLLDHFEDPHVAGVWGGETTSTDRPLPTRIYRQNLSTFLDYVYFGFSNANGAARKAIWQTHHFREDLPATEDKEWAYWALGAGYSIVYDSRALVLHDHRESIPQIWRRSHRINDGFTRFLQMPPFSALDVLRYTYWGALADWQASEGGHRRVGRVARNLPKIMAGEVGRYTGLRAGNQRLRYSPARQR
jgi:glycosyltransferase involved in cell wall biosynthesis